MTVATARPAASRIAAAKRRAANLIDQQTSFLDYAATMRHCFKRGTLDRSRLLQLHAYYMRGAKTYRVARLPA